MHLSALNLNQIGTLYFNAFQLKTPKNESSRNLYSKLSFSDSAIKTMYRSIGIEITTIGELLPAWPVKQT